MNPDLIGRQIGSYRIVSLLGAGAMGEVYRAQDDRLGREVAVKVLPAAFARDEDRLRRFQQEARAAGQLNHPNIMAVYDVGDQDGSPYIVCELLDGETLRRRIDSRPIPARRAIEYATQIAHGLAAAHDQAIIHRDLKPENVFVTKTGQVKILDFGLAKLAGVATGDAATIAEATQPGVVLGTPSYMSPEQVRGAPADHRSDIFSLGAVLYEMLSGEHPFRRPTTPDTMSAILRDEPREFAAALAVPPVLERVVRHCLEKEPAARFQSARDLAFALDAPSSGAFAAAAKATPRSPWSKPVLAAAVVVALASAAAISAFLRSRSVGEQGMQEVRVHRLTDAAGLEEFPAISPDGRSVAFTAAVGGNRQIFVRLIAGGAPLQITHDAADHQLPRWTPDSSSIVYFSSAAPGEMRGALSEVSSLGGAPRRIADSLGAGADVGLTDGRLAFFRLAGGRVELVTASRDPAAFNVVSQFPPVVYYLSPRWSPDGKWIAYQRGDGLRFDIFVVPASGGEPRQLTHTNILISGLAWTPDGSGIVYSSSSSDTMPYLPSMRLQHVRLADGRVTPVTSGEASYAYPDVARSGAIVVSRMRLASNIWKFPVAGSPVENVRASAPVTRQTGHVLTPSAGPGDKEIVFLSDSGGHANLWVSNTETGELRQITRERDPTVAVGVPVWSPDGRSIAFVYSKGNPGLGFGVWLVDPDGSNLRSVANPGLGPAWSLDGRWLYYSTRGGAAAEIVMKKVPAQGGTPLTVTSEKLRNVIGSDGSTVYYTFERPLVDGRPEFEIRSAQPENAPFKVLARIPASRVPIWQIVNPALSPDGKWLAQALTDSAATNIWALSTATGDWRQITDFGDRPTFIARRVSWSSDGRFILAAVGEGDSDIVLLEGFVRGAGQ
jgi:Tol biopolymer transport system component/tRNA A-37 threonylcarbamoyl transferase component Bud32